MTDHRFGGDWTQAKLGALQYYVEGYSTALKHQPFRRMYIDAFAGRGDYIPKRAERDLDRRRGSARIALEHGDFHQYLFIERNPSFCSALQDVATAHPKKKVEIHCGEAETVLRDLCRPNEPWRNRRAVLFLDPYGLQVSWETLTLVAGTKAIDLWYLFPLNGVTRQLAHSEARVDASKQAALDRVLGTPTWREAFYSMPPIGDLFGPSIPERHADTHAIVDFITHRLRSVFPAVTDPAVLRKSKPGRPQSGPPLFALYFAASNVRGAKPAMNIAKGALTRLQREGFIA